MEETGMFAGVTLPFDVGELITAATDLLGLIGPFVLLAISFVVVPKLVRIIKGSLGSGGKN
jgi:hypothetical protein